MTGTLDELAELARLEAERDGLEERLAAANRHLAEADLRYDAALAALVSENEDVARLESMSMTRILAGLRGTRDTDLSREQAEVQAAEYAAADADARRESAQAEVDDLVRRLGSFPDLEARRTELLARREQEIATDPAHAATQARLSELASRQGALEAELAQLEEALTAANEARAALGQAAQVLGSAGDWATYDTFLGGGFFADLAKHDRLDQANDLMRHADGALRHLATELADVQVDAVGDVGITDLTRAFDVWFDDIFSDWTVLNRIKAASVRVGHVIEAVDRVGAEVGRRRAGVRFDLEELAERRGALLEGRDAAPGASK